MKDNEYEKWANSLEGIIYELKLIGDEYVDNENFSTIIAKTLKKIPKKVRNKVLTEVTFIVDVNYGVVLNLFINNPNKKVIIEHSIILLNKLAMERETESFITDVIAHEISHFILGHHKKTMGMRSLNEKLKMEKQADDLIVKWGFNRTNEELYKDKVKK